MLYSKPSQEESTAINEVILYACIKNKNNSNKPHLYTQQNPTELSRLSWGPLLLVQINSSPPGQYGRHFADYIFKCIFMNEKFCILIQVSLKFIPKGQIDNNSALFQAMAWRRTGDKPLPEAIQNQFINTKIWH